MKLLLRAALLLAWLLLSCAGVVDARGRAGKKSNDKLDELIQDERSVFSLITKVDAVYDKLNQPTPFMTWIMLGLQSIGKSTLVERFLNHVLNVVKDGTGTRCPLDVTVIHDDSMSEPLCDLAGSELANPGRNLTFDQVFAAIVEHNEGLGEQDRFSTERLRLVVRAKDAQSMRFVDLPGLILAMAADGADNRQAIKGILVSEMSKPNTKLCVLLEPKELQTNAVIDFLDEALGGRDQWLPRSTLLMNKFDKQLEDLRSGSKANEFLESFEKSGMLPYLVMTPTLAKTGLGPEELFEARQRLLKHAGTNETQRFETWLKGHYEHAGDAKDLLHTRYHHLLGFQSVKSEMRRIMLEHTKAQLPYLERWLMEALWKVEAREKLLKDQKKLSQPENIQRAVHDVLRGIERKILSYLDGDLKSAIRFPEMRMSLRDEVQQEEDNWSLQKLDLPSDAEWRELIRQVDLESLGGLQAQEKFVGGKQVQRAIHFFHFVLVKALPDPSKYEDLVTNSAGFLNGNVHGDNWERVVAQMTEELMRNVTTPGVNYLTKHIGSIFSHLFDLSIRDVELSNGQSAADVVPPEVMTKMGDLFDEMVLRLMQDFASKIHEILEAYRRTVDPSLVASRFCIATSDAANALSLGTFDQLQQLLWNELEQRNEHKRAALLATRNNTASIVENTKSYLVALAEFTAFNVKLLVSGMLFLGFKEELDGGSFIREASETDWVQMVGVSDPSVDAELTVVVDQKHSLIATINDVKGLKKSL